MVISLLGSAFLAQFCLVDAAESDHSGTAATQRKNRAHRRRDKTAKALLAQTAKAEAARKHPLHETKETAYPHQTEARKALDTNKIQALQALLASNEQHNNSTLKIQPPESSHSVKQTAPHKTLYNPINKQQIKK